MNAIRGLVSVIVPTYDRASVVPRALDSVLAQEYPDFELIVVDDGSKDGTAELLERYAMSDRRVRVVSHQTNRGVTAAKNSGLDAARGEYALILDSDGDLRPHALHCLVSELNDRGPDYGMIFADLVELTTGKRTGGGLDGSGDVTYEDAICGAFFGDFLGLWRTHLTADLRFDERVPGGQSLVWYQIYRRSRVAYVAEVLGSHDMSTPGSVSKTRRGDVEKYRGRALLKELYIGDYGADLRELCPDRLAHHYQGLALYLALTGRRRQASQAAVQALRVRPSVSALLRLAIAVAPKAALETALERRRDDP